MPKRPKAVRDIEDAYTFLAYWSRFNTGDIARNMAGCLDVLTKLDLDLEETRQRCATLAARLEQLEASQSKEEGL